MHVEARFGTQGCFFGKSIVGAGGIRHGQVPGVTGRFYPRHLFDLIFEGLLVVLQTRGRIDDQDLVLVETQVFALDVVQLLVHNHRGDDEQKGDGKLHRHQGVAEIAFGTSRIQLAFEHFDWAERRQEKRRIIPRQNAHNQRQGQ